jgi:lysophospholipase L1-like esterase
MNLAPYLRGTVFEGVAGIPYPRALPADAARLPADTWGSAQIPVGVRLEFIGGASGIEVGYNATTDDLGYRGEGAGVSFSLWCDDALVDTQPAVMGLGSVQLKMSSPSASTHSRWSVYLPEGMKPTVVSLQALGGEIEPAPLQPRWLCYGDSIAEGWIASEPARGWPAVAARRFGFDTVNLGYAGSARGEMVSAEEIASLPAEAISISHGTNCWTRIEHSARQVGVGLEAFISLVRSGHPDTPIVVVSPVLRPDAEAKPNRLGSTLSDIRAAIEQSTESLITAGDVRLSLLRGGPLLTADHLPDAIHPGDEGHELLADAIGAAVAAACGR